MRLRTVARTGKENKKSEVRDCGKLIQSLKERGILQMCCFVILLLFNKMQMSLRRFSAIPHLRASSSLSLSSRTDSSASLSWENSSSEMQARTRSKSSSSGIHANAIFKGTAFDKITYLAKKRSKLSE